MTKNGNQDSELMLALSRKYNSDEQMQKSQSRILETKGAICYNVDLQGRLGTICAGVSTVSEGYSFDLHGYPFHRLVFTISGQVRVDNKKGYTIADPGSVYYFQPRQSGAITNNLNKPWKLAYLHFTGTDIPKILSNIIDKSENVLHVSNPAKIQTLFESIADSCLEQTEESQTICDSYLRILLIRLNSMTLDSREHPNASRLKYLDCYNYINNNFSTIISIENIADNCCISSIYLCRLFKQYAHISPMAYVTKLKMNKAALLLVQTDYSIKQISFMLKYENQYYFSRTFKRVYGISPKHYRENH